MASGRQRSADALFSPKAEEPANWADALVTMAALTGLALVCATTIAIVMIAISSLLTELGMRGAFSFYP